MKSIWTIAVAVMLAALPAVAQETSNRVAVKTDWDIFVESDPTQCWVVSVPKETVNTRGGKVVSVRRGDIYLIVSFWPEQKLMGEVSFTGGYPFASGSTVELSVGSSTFELFTDGETAWASNAEADRTIAAALKRGAEAKVVGRSSRGAVTTDTFSLMGFTAAYEDARKRCGS